MNLGKNRDFSDLQIQSLGEFKSTLRIYLHTMQRDTKMEHAIIKTINGFLNADGGTLVVGVNDNGEALGLDMDSFENEDKIELHLGNLNI